VDSHVELPSVAVMHLAVRFRAPRPGGASFPLGNRASALLQRRCRMPRRMKPSVHVQRADRLAGGDAAAPFPRAARPRSAGGSACTPSPLPTAGSCR
jgi:hypothetical protein